MTPAVSSEPSRIALNFQDIGSVVGHEFYLTVYNPTEVRRTLDEIRASAGVLRRVNWALHSLASLVTGRERRRRWDDFAAAMLEITSREPHHIRGYLWPFVDRVEYADDHTSVGEGIQDGRLKEDYLFVPDEVVFQESGVVFEGSLRGYDMHDNQVQDLSRNRVLVGYEKVPSFKHDSAHLACL